MNKKEMVEEMAKVLCLFCKEMTEENECERGKECYDWRLKEASFYYAHGYRKIPKGSIVLTREEYQELKQAKTLLEFREETIKYLEDANIRYAEALELKVNKKARKETAKEILQELWHSKLETTIEVSSKHNKEDIKIACLAVVDLIRDKIQEIAKQYDVEVKE